MRAKLRHCGLPPGRRVQAPLLPLKLTGIGEFARAKGDRSKGCSDGVRKAPGFICMDVWAGRCGFIGQGI